MNEMMRVFREEAGEHLAALEAALLELEQRPHDPDQVSVAFRAMHTIKGSAGMVGHDHLSQFTHHLETFFDEVRSGRLSLGQQQITLVLQARDHIEALLDQPEPEAALCRISQALEARFQALRGEAPAEGAVVAPAVDSTAADETVRAMALTLRPSRDAFTDGFDLLPILNELHELGDCLVATRLAEDIDPAELVPAACGLECRVLMHTAATLDRLQEVFFFVADEWRITMTRLAPVAAHAEAHALVDAGLVRASAAEAWCDALVTEAAAPAADDSGEATSRSAATRRGPDTGEAAVRVPQRKLDMLLDQVAEMVIMQSRLEQLALEREDDALDELAEELGRLSGNLRDTAFDIRMLPIGSTFGRFRRLVRDLAGELGKEVTLETTGAETELDKVMLDRLGDPLVHLLRNSLDHGIESPEVRVAAGKPATGRLRLSAEHHQGQVVITIADDGAGLNAERILAKARANGLVGADETLEPRDIHQLIFEPGLSTAASVSDVSGRGVGMDVVRSSVESLQGRVFVESAPGSGTRISISLPMTLAIIDGLMLAVGQARFVLPLTVVEECIETYADEATGHDGARLVEHRGGLLPCRRLRECFHVAGVSPPIEQSVIVKVGGEFFGITVDAVIGHHQTVIKGLGRLYQGTPGIMGATILGNGEIAMILDVAELFDGSR